MAAAAARRPDRQRIAGGTRLGQRGVDLLLLGPRQRGGAGDDARREQPRALPHSGKARLRRRRDQRVVRDARLAAVDLQHRSRLRGPCKSQHAGDHARGKRAPQHFPSLRSTRVKVAMRAGRASLSHRDGRRDDVNAQPPR
jgi:hypothetical protein